MKRALLLVVAVTVCLPVFAGDKAERDDWMNQAREKETGRANEAAQHNGNVEHMEKKYGWLKQEHPEKYADMASKRQAAAEAWEDVAERVAKTKTYEEIRTLQGPAYKAEAEAEMARLELKAAGTAAALSLEVGTTPRKLDVRTLRNRLRANGAILSEADIERANPDEQGTG